MTAPAIAAPTLTPNPEFAATADRATLARTADALRAKGYDVHVAADLASAKDIVLGLVPDGAEVNIGATKTIEDLGVRAEIDESGRYDSLRPRLWAMDRATQMREIRKLGSAPDVFLNSANALTEDGTLLFGSFSGSQIGPIATGAGQVILAIGANKIVPDLATGLRRIHEYCFPLVDAGMRAAYGMGSAVNKILILDGDMAPARISVVLIPESVGY